MNNYLTSCGAFGQRSQTWVTRLLLTSLLLGMALASHAQLTVILESIPPNTPPEDSLYLVGSFNDWREQDRNYIFKKQANGQYALRLPFRGDFEYKVMRGTWEKVEGSFNGEAIANRAFNSKLSTSDTIFVNVVSWEDLPPHSRRSFDNITFIVDGIPNNTPKDASVYIVGNFNDWHPGAPSYKLKKLSDGTYTITLPIWLEKLEFKFTRGDWPSVEGRRNGQARMNREYVYDRENTTIHLEIESWEDLSGTFFSFYTFLLIFAAAQGLLLIMAIYRLQDNNRPANNILSILILMISIALMARVSTYSRDVFNWQPKLLLVSDMIFFTYGPVFLFYIQKLLTQQPKTLKQRLVHFIPAIAHFLAYLPLLFMPKQEFISKVVDQKLHLIFAIAGGLALAFNTYYWWRCVQVLNNYRKNESNQHSFEENVQYLNTVMTLKAICLVVWLFTFAVSVMAKVTGWDLRWLTEASTDTIWIVFSSITYFLGYFAMSQPEVFKQADTSEEEAPAAPAAPINTDELAPMKSKLHKLMEKEKPYLNPKLTLGELADMLDTNTHTLSRVINDGFGKNFFDFVNSYRIEEFKRLIAQNAHKNHTLLAVALEVGFNSKTAFNRSFKKLTDMTPGKYLKTVHGEEVESE